MIFSAARLSFEDSRILRNTILIVVVKTNEIIPKCYFGRVSCPTRALKVNLKPKIHYLSVYGSYSLPAHGSTFSAYPVPFVSIVLALKCGILRMLEKLLQVTVFPVK